MIQKVRAVSCGQEGCEWGQSLWVMGMSLTADSMSFCYGRFWQHMVEAHGLNPDTCEAPGIEAARFYVHLTMGTCTVELRAKATVTDISFSP